LEKYIGLLCIHKVYIKLYNFSKISLAYNSLFLKNNKALYLKLTRVVEKKSIESNVEMLLAIFNARGKNESAPDFCRW